MQDWHFDLASYVRWKESGFEPSLVYSSAFRDDGEPELLGVETPHFGLGAGGTLLFWSGSNVLLVDPATRRPRPLAGRTIHQPPLQKL